jgi:uncharacterized membrane protein (UPF0127 family)
VTSRRAVAVAVLVAVALGALGVALVLVLGDRGGDEPSAELAAVLATAGPAAGRFEGLTEVDLGVGGRCRRVVVADSRDERVQGLRGVTDLAPYYGMLFVLDDTRAGRFTMQDTLIPLDIGFYEPGGAPVGRIEMVPCPPEQSECPTYGPDAPFLLALETPAGGLGAGSLGACA